MSDPDDQSLILELIRRIDSKLDAFDVSCDQSCNKVDASLARIEEAVAQLARQMAASDKRLSDGIEDLRRLVEGYHAELIRETGGRLRPDGSPVAEMD